MAIRSIIFVLIEQFLKMSLGIFVGVYVARQLGATDFGHFSYLVSIVSIVGCLTRFGLDGIGVKLLAQSEEMMNDFFKMIFLLIMGGVINAMIMAILSAKSDVGIHPFLFFILGFNSFFQISSVFDWYYQANNLSYISSTVRSVSNIATNLMRLGAILFDLDIVAFVTLLVLENLLMLVIFSYKAHRDGILSLKIFADFPCFKIREIYELVRLGFPMLITLFSVMLYGKYDQILVLTFQGPQIAGLYAAVVKLHDAWLAIPFLITTQMIPKMVSAREKSFFEYTQFLSRLYALIFLGSILYAVFIIVFADYIILKGFGESYLGALDFLPFIMLVTVLASVISFNTRVLIAEGMYWQVTWRALSCAVTSVVGWYWLIPIYGLYAAIGVNILSLALSAFAFDYMFSSTPKELIMAKRGFFRIGWSR